jgi:hypothetical protein
MQITSIEKCEAARATRCAGPCSIVAHRLRDGYGAAFIAGVGRCAGPTGAAPPPMLLAEHARPVI